MASLTFRATCWTMDGWRTTGGDAGEGGTEVRGAEAFAALAAASAYCTMLGGWRSVCCCGSSTALGCGSLPARHVFGRYDGRDWLLRAATSRKPAAITVIFTDSFIASSITAPKIIFAFSCAAFWMMEEAS